MGVAALAYIHIIRGVNIIVVKMNKQNIKINKCQIFKLMIIIIWSFNTIINYAAVFMGKFPVLGTILQDYTPAILIIILSLINYKIILNSLTKIDYCIVFIVVTCIIITVLVDSFKNIYFREYIYDLLFTCIPIYIITVCYIKRLLNTRFIQMLEYNSCLCIISVILAFSFSNVTAAVQDTWMSNQYIAYLMLPHVLLLISSQFSRFNFIKFFIMNMGIIYIILQGNRGTLICIASLFCMLMLYKLKNNKNNILKQSIALSVFSIIGCYFNLFNSILAYLENFAESNGYSTRIFMLFNGNFQQIEFDSGRSYLQNILIENLMYNPYGFGLGADKYFVGEYAHNVFLEILFEFGIILGTPIVVFIIGLTIVNAFALYKNWESWVFFSLLFSISIVKLCISGTYITDPFFFAYIAMLLHTKNIKQSINII